MEDFDSSVKLGLFKSSNIDISLQKPQQKRMEYLLSQECKELFTMTSFPSLDSISSIHFQSSQAFSSGSSGTSTSTCSPAGIDSIGKTVYSDSGLGSSNNEKRKCNLCHNAATILHELPCLHNFCQSCYESSGGKTINSVECEPCHNEDKFTNLLTSRLLAEIDSEALSTDDDAAIEENQGNEIQNECTSCTEPSKAVATCVDCKKFLCLNCEMAHQFMYCFDGHKVVELTELGTSNSQSQLCSKHDAEIANYSCKSCDVNVCKQCALADHAGDVHECYEINDDSSTENDAFRSSNEWKHKAISHKKALDSLDASPDRLLAHYHKAVRETHETFEFYLSTLEDRKQELLRQLNSVYSEKIVASQMMRQKAQSTVDEIHQACQLYQRISTQGDRISERIMVEQLINSKLESLKSINLVANLQSSCILEFVSNFQAIQVGVKNTFGYIRSGSASKVETHESNSVSRFIGEPLVAGTVSSSTIAEVVLSNSPVNPKSNELLKRYGMTETLTKQPNDRSRGGNSKSSGEPVVSSTSKLLPMTVPSSGHRQIRRQKMSYDCKFGEFGTLDGQFGEPSGVAVNGQDNIIVADTQNHRIQVFDLEGRFKFKFGASGQGDGSFSFPNRVAVDQTYNDIIVTERYPTCQIQIYNQYGMFIRKFGTDILSHPRGITVDNKGRIILVECKVMLVFIFDRQGNVLKKFGCSKHLAFPNGVAVNNREEIFISDNRSHCIKVFNYDGVFLRQIGGEGMTNYPIGVAIDSAGHVLVADNHNNFNLTIFTQQGQFLSAFESKAKHAQCYDMAVTEKNSVVLATKEYRLFVYNYSV